MKNRKKNVKRRFLALLMAGGMILSALPALAPEAANQRAARAVTDGTISLNGEWKYCWMGDDSTELAGTSVSDWETVSVPHCWNAEDGADGGDDYARGTAWYSRTVTVTAAQLAGQVFFECEGASQQADVYVNGAHVGNHKGGYTAFRYNITDYLIAGENQIDVKVDNSDGGTTNTIIAPIVGDFTLFGGLYRDVNLIFTDDVHIDLTDADTGEVSDSDYSTAGAGLYLATSDVSASSATLTVTSDIVNDSNAAKTVTVTAILREQDASAIDWLEDYENLQASLTFNPEDMGDGSEVTRVSESLTVPANGSVSFERVITVSSPHLWNGKEDPFRYEVELQIAEGGSVIETVSDYVGFRSFEVTKDGGFTLNGASYPLRGVSRHQDSEGLGYALSEDEHDRDFSLIYEIGANSVRLAHYPQDSYFYDLCDQFGIVVWAEIPFIGGHNSDSATAANATMKATTKQQLRELIMQQFNHPSICFWGLENEVGHQATYTQAATWISELNAIAHTLDPSRLTTMATNNTYANSWSADLIAWNTYPGWYNGSITGLGSNLDSYYSSSGTRPVGLSEYGAGGNPYQHEYNTKTSIGSASGDWHPEEFQSDAHEEAIKAINERSWLWCAYVWNMFDFGSDSRDEGDNPGINDKGLVSYDRTLKKDSFYLYKANWNQEDIFVHLTSQRDNPRESTDIEEIKVYSNCDTVTLSVNGEDLGEGTAEGNGVFTWSGVTFAGTENLVIATGTKDSMTYTDTCTWQRVTSNSTNLISDTLLVSNDDRTVGLTQNCTAAELADLLTGENNASWQLFESDGVTPVSGTASVLPGMKLTVTAEDGETQAVYTLTAINISYGKTVYSSGDESGNAKENAVDFDTSTRWASDMAFKNKEENWITVDLGQEYYITSTDITWFNSSTARSYQYEIQVSDDNVNFTTVKDCSDNTQQDLVHDDLESAKGRYLRVNVLGCSAGTNYSASLYELEVNGWMIESETYEIDHENRVITVGTDSFAGQLLYPSEFLANITLEGSAACTVDAGSYFMVNGDRLVITVNDGTEIVYTIEMQEPDYAPLLEEAVAQYQQLQASDYTQESWEAFAAALSEAQAALDNPEAANADLGVALGELLEKYNALTEAPQEPETPDESETPQTEDGSQTAAQQEQKPAAQVTTGTEKDSVQADSADIPAVGQTYNVGQGVYRVTQVSSSGGEVSLVKPQKKTYKKFTVPATVKIEGQTYKVTAIGPGAFKNNKKLTAVVIGKNVRTIGKKAFMGDVRLKTITVKSKKLKSVGAKALKGINARCTVKVPKNKRKAYRKYFGKYIKST